MSSRWSKSDYGDCNSAGIREKSGDGFGLVNINVDYITLLLSL
jgi:hypothetical protein